jgi:hypothetical protein
VRASAIELIEHNIHECLEPFMLQVSLLSMSMMVVSSKVTAKMYVRSVTNVMYKKVEHVV